METREKVLVVAYHSEDSEIFRVREDSWRYEDKFIKVKNDGKPGGRNDDSVHGSKKVRGAILAYQWHDLKENSTDLPERGGQFLAVIEDEDGYRYTKVTFRKSHTGAMWYDEVFGYNLPSVRAWAEVPKFKGDR